MVTLEEILRYHGDPGRCQLIIWILLLFTLFHVGMIQQFNILISFTPPHHCKLPLDQNGTEIINQNWTEINIANETNITLYDGNCKLYINPKNTSIGTTGCTHGYEYESLNDVIFPSSEFDLVCDDFHWVESTLAITFCGVLIGGLIFGPISDRYGRQRTLSFLITGLSILSTSVFFVKSFEAFVAIRFFLGIFNQGIQTTGLTYCSELFLAKMRTYTTAAVGILWAFMLPNLALLFYTLGHWRYVHLFMGTFSCLSAVYMWFLPESVSWLVSKWKINQAVKTLNIFARFNGIPNSLTLKDDLENLAKAIQKKNTENNAKKAKWTQLFTTPIVRRIMLSLMYIWFTTACVVFGLSFSISALKGNNMYINYLITGCLEITERLAIMTLFVRYGRITVMSPILFSCGILTIAGFLTWHYVPNEYVVVQTIAAIIALFGRNLIAVNFTMLVIFTSELVPVSLRSSGVGFGFSAARFGNVLSPYTRFLKSFWTPLPQMLYGIMAIGAGAIILTLPETFNKALPNTMQDVVDLAKSKKNLKLDDSDDTVAENGPQLQSLIYESSRDFIESPNNHKLK